MTWWVGKSGGKLGVTAWAAGTSQPARLWRHIAESFAGEQALRQTIDAYQPWSDRFSDPGHIVSVLQGAGGRQSRAAGICRRD